MGKNCTHGKVPNLKTLLTQVKTQEEQKKNTQRPITFQFMTPTVLESYVVDSCEL